MCLDTVYRGKQKRDALAKLPESGYYWKAVRTDNGRYAPTAYFNNSNHFVSGWNTTGTPRWDGYPLGFHLFRAKNEIKSWANIFGWSNSVKYLRCKVEKKDIVAIGKQHVLSRLIGLCIVTTRFWCPKPK